MNGLDLPQRVWGASEVGVFSFYVVSVDIFFLRNSYSVEDRSLSVVCFGSCYFCVSVQPLCDVISICQINEIFVRLSWQPSVAPPTFPMAPPSPSTNSSTNNSSSSSSTTGWEQLSKTNLYIRGLPPGTTDHDLAKICQPWVLAVMSWRNH